MPKAAEQELPVRLSRKADSTAATTPKHGEGFAPEVEELYAEYEKQPKDSPERPQAFNRLLKAIEDEVSAL